MWDFNWGRGGRDLRTEVADGQIQMAEGVMRL